MKFYPKLGALIMASCITITPTAYAQEIHEIDQIMDMSALTPEEFYRFEPNYYWVDVGDVIRFNNTTGNHTVKSIEGIWPDGPDHLFIKHQPAVDIHMTTPGVYGFLCTVHARHGMFALVIVGSPEANVDQINLSKLNGRGKVVFEKLLERMHVEWLTR